MKDIRLKYSIIGLIVLLIVVFQVSLAIAAEDDGYYYLDIIQTNDIHGGITKTGATFMNPEFPPPLGGGGSLVTYFNERREFAKKNGAAFLLVDDGDWFSGTPIGTKTEGMAVMNFFNMAGYDAIVIGNHEFDKGYQALEKLIRTSKCPVLGANIIDKRTGKIASGLKPYIIKDYGFLKVGIIGIGLTATPTMALPEHMGYYDFLPEGEVLKKYVRIVRPQCDILMVITHMFLPYDPMKGWDEVLERKAKGDSMVNGLAMYAADEIKGIDLMCTGHVHKGYYHPWEDPINHTIICQSYANGTGAGEILLKIDKKTKTIVDYKLPAESGTQITMFEDEFPPDSAVADYIAKEQAIAEKGMDEPFGYTEVNLTRGSAAENTMGLLIVDAFRKYYNADFSFSNIGGIRAEIPAGEITPRQLFKVMPFGNHLVKFKIKGSTLKKIVETKLLSDRSDRGLLTSGAKIVYNKTRPKWDRITEFVIGGKPLNLNQYYNVITTDYLAEGNSGMDLLLTIPQKNKTYTYDLDIDVVEDYIRNNSPIRMKPDNRFKRDDSSQQANYLKNSIN